METSGDLHRGGSVTLDAGGKGSIILTPDNSWQRWEIDTVQVSTNQPPTAVAVPIAEVFVNAVSSRMNSRGASWSGNQDTFTGLTKVGPCDFMTVVFTPGPGGPNPGVVASAVVEGTYYTKRGN